ncbi:MAG: protoporphyrinogen oxidase [Acidimicrobiia bacterium]|nr:protoporphyrinogen oxidase [Acidimicrobiia bacterium]
MAIVGGGLGGLFAALALEAVGVDDLLVLEATGTAGGVARTLRDDGYALGPGASSFLLPNPALSPLLERVGAKVEPAHASRRFVYMGDRLRDVSAPTRALGLLPFGARPRVLAEPFVKGARSEEDETVEGFLIRRLGKGAGVLAGRLMAAGVFAGDSQKLSVRSAFPVLAQLEAQHGSLARGMIARLRSRPAGAVRPHPHIPVGGIDGLADAFVAHLGDRFRSDFPVSRIASDRSGWRLAGPEEVAAEHVVLAIPAREASRLLPGDTGEALTRTVSAPVVVAAFSAPAEECALPVGFGALVPGGLAALGVLFESSYAPQRAPQGRSLVKVIAGGARRPDVAEWTSDRVQGELGEEVQRILGWPQAPELEILARRAIPQYPLGHQEWLASLERLVGGTNLHLAGWSYRGPGLAQLAANASRIARAIAL